MDKMYLQIGVLCFIGLLSSTGFALECYVCTGQFDNKDKCIKSSVQCRQEQDTCLTHIQWKAPDFWTPRSEKIHIVGKRCGTSAECNHLQRRVGLKCMRDWYRDWECFECCQGDRCNYYVTLGASSMTSSVVLLVTSLLTALYMLHR